MSRDQRAAQQMVQASGQTGVPVITVDGNVVVGFDQARLEQLIPAPPRGRFGASVRSEQGGLLVGAVHPGSPAERAGLRSGDVVRSLDGVPVRTADELQAQLARLQPNASARLEVQRAGQPLMLHLPPPS